MIKDLKVSKILLLSLLRLRSIYDLTLDHVLEGRVLGLVAVRRMRGSECFFMANVAYKAALMPEEFQVWYKACQTVSIHYGQKLLAALMIFLFVLFCS